MSAAAADESATLVARADAASGAQILGTALREARLKLRPPVTLMQLGTDPAAPRKWSHSHLSKVERGLELPKRDLVLWYQRCTGTPLIDIFEDVVGSGGDETGEAAPSQAHPWRFDRVEVDVYLDRADAFAIETRDYIAQVDGLTRVWKETDTADRQKVLSEQPETIVSGGVIVESPVHYSDTMYRVDVALGRTLNSGDWHRIVALHPLGPVADVPRWMTVVPWTVGTRDVVVIVHLPSEQGTAWALEGFRAELVQNLFGPGGTSDPEPFLGEESRLVPDDRHVVRARFRSPAAGFHYGVGWRL